jgi:hypothetical protein
MDSIVQARKILRNTNLSWLELDLDFSLDVWKSESVSAEQHYQEYRDSDSRGWASCCLHGLDIDKIYTADKYNLDEYTAPYRYTELADKCPSITNFWKNQFPAERYTRIRFMKVGADGYIDWHNDGVLPPNIDPLQSILPINLAIVHPKECEMKIDNDTVPWKEGKIIMINISKQHAVFNRSSQDRIHMIANVILGNRTEEFCNMLVRCYNKQYGEI